MKRFNESDPNIFRGMRTALKIILILALAGSAIFIISKFIWMKNNNWSMIIRQTEISVDNAGYDLGLDYWDRLDYINAESELKEALQIEKEKNGSDSLEAALVGMQLGRLYLEMGRYDESYELLSSSYVTYRNQLGENDGNTIIAKCQISIYDIYTDNAERGFAALNDAYDAASYVGYKLQICRMLADCNTEIGDYEKAYEWYQLLAGLYNEFGLGDQTGMELSNNFGKLLMELGDYDTALNSFEGAMSRWEALNRDEDLSLSSIYLNLASAHAALGEYQDAAEAGKNALNIRQRLFGDNNIYVALAYEKLAAVYGKLGDQNSQLTALNNALSIALNTVGENHAATALIYNDIGDYFYSNWDAEEAINNHQQALEIRKNILGVDNINTVLVYENLAYDYLEVGNYEKAVENADIALETCDRVFGKDSPNSINAFNTAAEVYCYVRRLDEARYYVEISKDICSRYFNRVNARYAKTLAVSAFAYTVSDEKDSAQDYWDKALMVYETVGSQKEIAVVHLHMGDIYLSIGDYSSASAEYKYTRDILNEIKSDTDFDSTVFERRIEQIYEQTEDPTKGFSKWFDEWKTQ